MKSDFSTFMLGMAIGYIIGIIFMIFIKSSVADREWRKDAISQGFAEYNQTNGNWQWKTNILEK